jgi:hypothetical protein
MPGRPRTFSLFLSQNKKNKKERKQQKSVFDMKSEYINFC